MLRIVTLAVFLYGVGFAPVMAGGPPKDAEPLSKILQNIEQEDGFSHFDEIEWEDGYWEIEYFTTGRAKVKIKIVPTSESPAPSESPAAASSAEPSGPQPLTRDACETAGLIWNENRNVCGVD